jgi:hypothetical protein
MQKIRFIYLLLISFFMVILVSCEYDKFEYEPEPPDGGNDTTDTIPISYSLEIQTIWTASCLGSFCHNTGAVAPDLTADKSYDALMNGGYINTSSPSESKLYKKISAGGSMNSFTTSSEDKLILEWIEEGAKNN